MASDAIGGSITFSTAIDNSDLEKGLEDAQAKVEDLKKKIEEKETERSGIEEQIRGAYEALEEASQAAEELQQRYDYLNSIDISNEQWAVAQMEIGGVAEKLDEARAKETELAEEAEKLDDAYHQADVAVEGYKEQLASAEQTAADLSQRVSSFYYQAGKAMQSSMDSVSQSVANLGNRISRLFTSAMVFNVLRQGLNALKHGIADALMQNEQFSASWTALTSAAQGFANGVANVIAPVVVQVINGVTACVMGLARAIDSVFHTSIGKSISAAQKSAQEAWRQTDASKAAQKQAEANAKAREKQQEQYAKAQERYRKQQEAAEKRAAKAQEALDKRKAAQEQKYTDAVDDAAERQAKAEQDAAEKMADAQQTAQERMEKAQAKAAERQQKAQDSANKRYEKAQQTAQARMTAAEQANADKQQAASERLAKAQEKAAQRQAKAEASAAERLAQAQETAAEKRASAEQANAERQQEADERLAKAQAKAAERLAKAEATAAQRNAEAQAAYEEKVAAAQAKEAANKAKFDEKQAKAAAKLEKAQKKANETVLGFDELNKMNADSSEEAAQATEDLAEYKSTLADIKPPKTYSVDPNDYMVDPADYAAKLKELKDYSVDASKYAVDPSDYFVDPADYAAKLKEINPDDYMVDPSEYQIDPSDYLINPDDYAIDLEDYAIDPEDFFVDPEDYAFDPSEYVIDPEDYAIDPFSFDWQEFPEIGAEEGLKPNWDAFDVGKIDEKMTAIMAIMGGALLAVGAILAFSGVNIPLGIGLMAVGALELAGVVGENWDKLPSELQNAITGALVLTGVVLIVIGAILTFTGANIPLGVGMMVAGAMLEWEAIALNWNSIPPLVQGVVSVIEGILGIAFLTIGALLVFTGANVPVGLGLMAFGAINLVAAAAINWDSLPPQIQTVISFIDAIVSVAFLTIGAILIFSGVNIPLGIGFLMVGAIGLVADVVANWGLIQSNVGQAIALLEAAVGIAFLAIGAVLVFSGANVPLGIGLLAVGALSMGAALTVGWDSLPPEIQAVITVIEGIVGIAFLAMGAIMLFTGANVPLGLGLLAIGAVSMGAAIAQAWDSLPPQVQAVITAIEVVVGAAFLAIGALLLFSGTNIPLGFGLLALGAVSMGAALVENWASLPPQVQAVITIIETALGLAFLTVGAILAFSGANVPLGIGLIAIGALSMGGALIENWEYITQNISTVIGAVEAILGTAALVIGTILAFSGANLPLGLALMGLGAIALAQAIEANWEKLPQDVQNTIATIEAAVSGATLALGFILIATGANLALGIGLVLVGALGLVQLATLDWEKMPNDLKSTIDKILVLVGGAMLVLGIILCFTGVGIPLGVSLILAGAATLATEAAINWDFLKDKVEEIWKGITQWWSNGPAKVFTAQWWTNLFNCIPNAIASAINAAIDAFNSFMEGISNALGSLVGATGGSFGGTSSVPSVRPPGLARGAVIPPNRQFMAVLGDQTRGNNIETPEALMRQVVREEAGSMMAEMMMQMQAMGTGQQQAEGGDVVLQIDSETIARASAKGSSMATRRGVLSPQASFI